MEKSHYNEQAAALFDEWEEKLKNDIHVGVDGAVDPVSYYASKPRIMFVLKEMYASPWERQNLCQFLLEDADRGTTWNNVYRWRQAIKAIHDGVAPTDIQFDNIGWIGKNHRLEALKDIAAINLKKEPGYASAHWATIMGHAEHFADLLRRQIKLLDPDVILACGVWLHKIDGLQDLKADEAAHNYTPKLFHFEGRDRLILWTEHPQARKNAKKMFDDLVNSCSEGYTRLLEATAAV